MHSTRRWFAALLLAFAAAFVADASAQGADGKIAFTRTAYYPDGSIRHINLYRINADGTAFRRLTPSVEHHLRFDPAWSPHGTYLAYSLITEADRWDVWRVDANGAVRRRLTTGAPDFRYPAWNPAGSLVGFLSTADDGATCIGVVRPDGTGQRNVLCAPTGSELQETAPFWLPDGRMLVVVRRVTEDPPSTFLDVYRVTVSTGQSTLVRSVEAGGEFSLFFAPDGRRAMMSTRFQGTTLIYVDLQTGQLMSFSPGYSPVWSPDSRRVAFARIVLPRGFPTDDVGHAFVADPTVPDSERDLNVALTPGLHYVPVDWSPDGTRILATRITFEASAPGAPIDTSRFTMRLLDADTPYIETLASGWAEMEAWFAPP